ncbi:MAG: ABC transporter ATP-binding protein [Gammaproteobacteria bacterium RIFCSPHIGHO2_12_FULL_37_34]|nr:MAG: ABC transporter ATP-binding protein [Gammaproteobacteria bacterium RIFCSPHIGHO2_12_FULL_37_34]
MTTSSDCIIEIKKLRTHLGGTDVHKHIDLSIKRGEILGIVGGSGSGKTTLMYEILGLIKPTSGTIHIFNHELTAASPDILLTIQKRWGVLFQQNALFSSLTLLENVSFPLFEHTCLDQVSVQELALLKILMAGLPIEAAIKYPAELSGGMQKRAGLARAIVLDPELIFLDEPTSGLDPDTAAGFDEMILNLQRTMGLTVVIITHDLDSLWRVTDRVAFLGEGVVLGVDTMQNLVKNPHPLIRNFFLGPRGRNIQHNDNKH